MRKIRCVSGYLQRFHRKIKITPTCWIWTASLDKNGYGQFRLNKYEMVKAHRLAWKIRKGNWAVNKCVLHSCDNRKCVNPTHLFLGLPKDNVADMIKKKRQHSGNVFGTDSPKAKLNERKVIYIRKKLHPQKYLAKKFNVSIAAIKHVQMRRSWKWLNG